MVQAGGLFRGALSDGLSDLGHLVCGARGFFRSTAEAFAKHANRALHPTDDDCGVSDARDGEGKQRDTRRCPQEAASGLVCGLEGLDDFKGAMDLALAPVFHRAASDVFAIGGAPDVVLRIAGIAVAVKTGCGKSDRPKIADSVSGFIDHPVFLFAALEFLERLELNHVGLVFVIARVLFRRLKLVFAFFRLFGETLHRGDDGYGGHDAVLSRRALFGPLFQLLRVEDSLGPFVLHALTGGFRAETDGAGLRDIRLDGGGAAVAGKAHKQTGYEQRGDGDAKGDEFGADGRGHAGFKYQHKSHHIPSEC